MKSSIILMTLIFSSAIHARGKLFIACSKESVVKEEKRNGCQIVGPFSRKQQQKIISQRRTFRCKPGENQYAFWLVGKKCQKRDLAQFSRYQRVHNVAHVLKSCENNIRGCTAH
jgi:hypothetical protein